MALITGGHLQRFLQKFFGVKGEIVAPEVGPEVHPVISITNLPAEHRFLDGITSWYKEVNVTGDATHPGQVLFSNPAGTNVQAKLLKALFYYTPGTLGSPLSFAIITYINAANQQAGFLLDSRARTVFAARSVCKTDFLATSAGSGVVANRPIGQPIAGSQMHQLFGCGTEALVNPGETLIVATAQNTEFLSGMFWWTERFLDPSEITA
ncbi:MAG TPA: hypothetical protein VHO48_05010 [Anaerolineaceae bacterium]|nr:hypothetical protein [Anaerolineaceae bacterium]